MKVQSLIGRKVNEALSPAPRSDVKVSLLPSLVTRWQLYFKSLRPQRRSRQKYPSSHNHAPVILLNAPLPRIFPSELTFKVIKGRVRFLLVTSSINSFDVVMTLGSANALLAVSERNKVNSLIGEWVILIGRLNCRLVSTVFVRLTTDTAGPNLDSPYNAIKTVNIQRSKLGAVSNRLSHTVNNLTNISSNLSAAQGGIEDADFAKETTDLAKNQILQQASTAMLAQANASKQNVLSLLQG